MHGTTAASPSHIAITRQNTKSALQQQQQHTITTTQHTIMVSRPPPKAGGATANGSGSNGSAHGKGMEWSLRSLRKIDTGEQHFLQNFYEDDSDSDSEIHHDVPDQSAYDIFKGKEEKVKVGENLGARQSVWASLNAPLRTGIVDGRAVIFELVTDVTQKPAISRSERVKLRIITKNADQSHWETRCRFWLMHKTVSYLCFAFLATFVFMNVVFAGLFYIDRDKCCGDPTFSFADVFNFAIQTSTTGT
jgi:hypothetical protein